jgi:hypothetical protein
MSFTRFHDDPNRIQKTNLETSAMNDYIFNVPGNSGYNNVFVQDPHIRLQKTGVNTHRNMIHAESQLLGIHIPLGRDNKITHNYKYFEKIQGINHPKQIEKTITKESRASHPAWLYRTTSQFRPQTLFFNPQENTEMSFDAYLDTNILEKDYYDKKQYKKI